MHDAHCHIDLYQNFRDQLASIAASQIRTIAVTNAPSVFEMCERICAGNMFVHPAVGLHPELAVERESELPILLRLMQRVRFIGEIGLDFTKHDAGSRATQIKVFTAILAAARTATAKVLSIHSRRAASEVVGFVGPNFPGTVILHWFSGHAKELRRAIEFGYYFSVNPAMTSSVSGRAIIASVPRDYLLLESDGPFVRVDAAPAGARDVTRVIDYVAAMWKMAPADVEQQLDGNLRRALE